MKSYYNVVIEKDTEGFLVASVPELPGCHTQANSMDQLIERIQEAIELCVEEYGLEENRNQFIGIQRIEIES